MYKRQGLPLLDRRADPNVLRVKAARRGNPVPVVPWRTSWTADLRQAVAPHSALDRDGRMVR